MNIEDLLQEASEKGASDLHIQVGMPPIMRQEGQLIKMRVNEVESKQVRAFIEQILKTDKEKIDLENGEEIDLALDKVFGARYRINIFKQKGGYALAIRLIKQTIPSLEELHLPAKLIENLIKHTKGLILVTGPTGSGKSTTLAAMVEWLNQHRNCHILTIEEPIEYLHKSCESLITQREVGRDTLSYQKALKAALREDPDVILVGEMRDLETISTVLTAAETGHLVLSTLHTLGTAQTIERMIDVFSTSKQQLIRTQVANVLIGVISQQLIPNDKGGRQNIALEILVNNKAVAHLIREGKFHQLNAPIQMGEKEGMITMEQSLVKIYQTGQISLEKLMYYAKSKEDINYLLEKL